MATSISSVDAYIASHPAPGTVNAPAPQAVSSTYTQGTNPTGQGVVKYDSNTGQLLQPGQSFTLPTTPTPTPKTISPVITASLAEKDYQTKLDTFKNLSAQVSQQKSLMAQQATQKAADDAQKQAEDAKTKLEQQKLGIQQQQADTQKLDSETKRQALSGLSPTPTTPAPTGAIASPTGTSQTDTSATQLGTALDQRTEGLDVINQARDSITQQSNQLLQSLQNGTIPLSGTQQTLITSLQNQLTQNENDQKQANNSYTGSVTEAGFRSGGEYTPEQYAGQIHNAISLGVSKIQALDNSAAITMANLEQEFQKGNFDIINKQYDNLTKALDSKADAIKDTYSTVTKALQDQRDFSYKATQDAFQNKLASDKFTYQQKQDVFDNYIKQQNLTLDQKKFATDTYFKQKDLDLKKAQADLASVSDPTVQSWVTNIKNGDAKFSDIPAKNEGLKNAVSAGLANGGNTSQAQAELINQTSDAIDTLLKTPGKSAAIGTNIPTPWSVVTDPADSLFFKGLPGSNSAAYLAQLDRVKNLMTLPNLKLLKGVGRITDREFQTLSSAMTSLNKNLPESVYNAELQRVKDVFDAKKKELDTTHNGISLPTSPSDSGSSYNGITLPN